MSKPRQPPAPSSCAFLHPHLPYPHPQTPAFEVEDIDATERQLRAHGVEYSRHVLPDVDMRQLFFYDPEG